MKHATAFNATSGRALAAKQSCGKTAKVNDNIQSKSIEFGASYGFTEDLTIGQQYKYFFKTDEIKKPVQEAVIACGWIYKGVVFGKL